MRLSRGLAAPLVVVVLWSVHAMLAGDAAELALGTRLSAPEPGASGPISLALGITYNVGVTWVLLSFLGLRTLFRQDSQLFWICVCGAGVPLVVLFGLSLMGRPVHPRYLFPCLGLLSLPAALLVASAAHHLRAVWRSAPVWVPVLALLPLLPGTVSHYFDGDRHDLRSALQFVERQCQEGDVLVCETHGIAPRYCRVFGADRIFEAPLQSADQQRIAALTEEGDRLWIVIPTTFQFLDGPRHRFLDWCRENGRLVRELYRRRFDYHQNRLEVFLLEAAVLDSWRATP